MKRVTILSIATLMCLIPGSAFAESSSLYYILDGSGSMWGRVDGKIKMEVAKDTLSTLLTEMPDNIESGLTVYGHRKKGDCEDIEEVIALGPLDRTVAINRVKAIKPKGRTPISDSISKTVEKLKGREGKATIVLVSDGIETCDKDPCAVTKTLKESGIKFTMHVVGFDVTGPTVDQLSCVANAGGGHYFEAKNSADLVSVLSTVKNSVVKAEALPPVAVEEPLVPAPKKIEQTVSSGSKSIKIKAARPGKVALKVDSWVKTPKYWKLFDPETGEEKARFSGLDPQFVTPGTYQLVWRQVEHGAREAILGEVFTVKAGETVEVALKTGLRLNIPAWFNKRPYYWRLKEPETGEIVASFSILDPQLVPAGQYEFIWREIEHGAREVSFGLINIEPDKLNDLELNTAANLVAAEWVHKKPYYWRFEDVYNPKRVWSFSKEFRPQLIPPGDYNVKVRLIEHGTKESTLGVLKVEKGKMNEFAINTGVKLNPPEGLEPPYNCEFIALDENGQEKGVAGGFWRHWLGVPLSPGQYKIRYHQKQHSSSPVTLVESFELPAGVLAEIDL